VSLGRPLDPAFSLADRDEDEAALNRRERERPGFPGLSEERMKGLEPSTVCMQPAPGRTGTPSKRPV